jgi:mannose/fructose/N-acetylgalactosamine-specific phosphotransferase system component IID
MRATSFRFFFARTTFAAVAAFVLVVTCAMKHENSFDQVEGEGIGSAKIAKGAPWVAGCAKLT